MARAEQNERFLTITTPLGKDYLLVEQMTVKEEISTLFEIDINLLYDEEEDDQFQVTPVKINQILGQTVSIKLAQNDGVERFFTGMVSNFSQIGRDREYSFFKARIVPHVWKLTQNTQSRIFQHKRIPDILKEVFDGYEIKMQVQADYKPRNYCVQYQETDFAFASRLMEEEGIYYYFEHSAETVKMVLRDDFKSPENCPNKHEIPIYDEDLDPNEDWESAVKSIEINYALLPGKVTTWDYNFQLPKKTLEAEKPSRFDVGGNQKLESYTFATGYARKYDGIDGSGAEQPSNLNNVFPDIDRTAQNRLDFFDAQHKILKGSSDCASLTPGYRFQLKNHPNKELNVQYIVVSVTQNANQKGIYRADSQNATTDYKNEFTCIPHGAGQPEFKPALKTPKPSLRGSQTAIVVGPGGEEIFTDKYGRVKVQFHWDRDRKFSPDSSCWIRVSQPWAGNNWGTVCIPRIGQEVIIDFIEGDPDQPIITGAVYNPATMPPYELPANANTMGFKSNTTKGGNGYNEFVIIDGKDGEMIRTHAQKDRDTTVKNDDTRTVFRNRDVKVFGWQKEEITGDMTTTVTEGNQANTVKTGKQDNSVQKDITITSQTGSITITAETEIVLKVGENKIVITKDALIALFSKGTISSESKNVTTIKGSQVVIN